MKKIIPRMIGFYFNILSILAPKMAGRQLFNAFCYPLSKKLKKYQSDFLEQARYNRFNHNGNNIQTYKWGRGSKKILLVHGWASHSFRWKSYIYQLLDNDYTIYAMDAPAHGKSSGKYLNLILYKDVIDMFIKEIGEIDAIIGHSIGGFACIYWLHLNTEKTNIKIAILAAPAEVEDFMKHYQKILKLSDRAMNIIYEEFFNYIGKSPSYFSSISFAKSIKNKALIVHDKYDKDTDFHDSIKLHQSWELSELMLTEGFGHSLKNKDLEKSIIQFLD